MEKEIKVGDTFRVFELTENFTKDFGFTPNSCWVTELQDDYLGNKYGVNIPIDYFNLKGMHIGIDDDRCHGVLKGVLKIKTLK